MVNGFHHCKISPFFTILLIKFFKPCYIVFDIWKYIVKASTIKTDYLYRYSNAKNSPKHSSRYKLSRADPEQCCWGGARTVGGGASSTALRAVEQVRPRQREALAEGAAAGVWGRKNRSPRVLECT